jgi:hypothetical protein
MTIGQMMKLVVFGAAGSLCLVPARPLVEEGVVSWSTVFLMEAVTIPLMSALVAFLLVRPGPFRDWLVLGLLVTPLAVALGAAVYLLTRRAPPGGADPEFLILVVFALAIPLLLIAFHIMPGRCPGCWRSWLFPVGTFRPGPRSSLKRAYRCRACKGHYWKHRGAWRPVPVDVSPPSRQESLP